MIKITITLAVLLLLPACVTTPSIQTTPPPSSPTPKITAAVVSASSHASDIGRDILAAGGNAVDAAIATAFALAVTLPEAGNIGGGGFMLFVPPKHQLDALPEFIDYRETAPAAAHRDTFRHHTDRSHLKMVGTPGTVRGLHLAHQRHAKLPWRTLVFPAVLLAAQGFTVDDRLASSLNRALTDSPPDRYPELHRVYAHPDRRPWQAGDTLTLPDLAATLHAIAADGPDAFYKGPIAQQLAGFMAEHGGLITTEDLANYQPKVRTPVRTTFRGHDLYGPPPPSSGGLTIALALNILNHLPLDTTGPLWTPHNLHLITEATKHAFRERAAHLGDPDSARLKTDHFTDPAFAKQIAESIDPQHATPSVAIAGDIPLTAPAPESPQTTHFSIIDSQGLAVANTYTLEASWGSRRIVPGLGFVLNNEMGDFNWIPGRTDHTGRIGTEPNLVAPGKRMLSSMSPFIAQRDGQTVLITGSPGGRTIINTVLGILLRRLAFDEPLRQAINAPRFHHQWLPDTLKLEHLPEIPPQRPHRDHAGFLSILTTAHRLTNTTKQLEFKTGLETRGHEVILVPAQGSAHSIGIDPKTGAITPAPDPRRGGHAATLRD
jgi:gamma-glutamyltranspeptidase/glutathione hydrolase